jgi:hypothetical protein
MPSKHAPDYRSAQASFSFPRPRTEVLRHGRCDPFHNFRREAQTPVRPVLAMMVLIVAGVALSLLA